MLASVALGYSVVYFLTYNILHYDRVLPFPEENDKNLSLFIYNIIPILILTVLNYGIIFGIRLPARIRRSSISKVAVDYAASTVGLVVLNVGFYLVAGMFGLRSKIAWPGTILCDTLLFLGMEIVYYIRNLKKTEMAVMQTRYDLLCAQINPHFLFNSLSCLYALIQSDRDKASEFTLHISDIYRYILDKLDGELIDLPQELDFLEKYVYILKIRYGDGLRLVTDTDEASRKCRVVPFTAQLLAENLARHNKLTADDPVTLNVTARDGVLTVSNRIHAKGSGISRGSGVGLKYLRSQYARHGKNVSVERGECFTVTIPLIN